MIIEPTESGAFEVVGVPGSSSATIETKTPAVVDSINQTAPIEEVKSLANGKRPAEDDSSQNTKKLRLEDDKPVVDPTHASTLHLRTFKGKGDVFLAHGEREKLKATLAVSLRSHTRNHSAPNTQPEIIRTLPFPLDDEEIYEPPQEEDQGKSAVPISRVCMSSTADGQRRLSNKSLIASLTLSHAYKLWKRCTAINL